MSSSRLRSGKADATSSSRKPPAKDKKKKKAYVFDATEYESEVTDDDGDADVEYEVDAIKYAFWNDDRDDRGWRYGVMWKGYLKSKSDTIEPLRSFNEDEDGRIPFIDDFWKAVADRPLMRGTHEPLSGRVDEVLETPKELLEDWLAKCRPRRSYLAYRRRRKADRNEDPITKGMSDYYLEHDSLMKFRRRQAAKAAGKRVDASDSDDEPRPPKKKPRGDMGPPAPVKPKKPSPPPEEDLPYSGPFPSSAPAGHSSQAGPSMKRNASETASLDSLFDEPSPQEGSRASSQVNAPATKRRRIVETSPEPPSKAKGKSAATAAAERTEKISKMDRIKKQKPQASPVPADPPPHKPNVSSKESKPPAASPSSFGELVPGIFDTPAPSPAMPSPAQSPYIHPSSAAQTRNQNPLFDFGDAGGRSPTDSEIDIDEAITVKAEEGAASDGSAPAETAAADVPVPAKEEAGRDEATPAKGGAAQDTPVAGASSGELATAADEPMDLEEEEHASAQQAPELLPGAAAVSLAVDNKNVAPDATAPTPTEEKTSIPPQAPAVTVPQKDAAPAPNGSAPSAPAPSSSTARIPASAGLPPKPIGAPAEDAGKSNLPSTPLPPSQRGKYVQPKRVKTIEIPSATNPQSKRLEKLVTKPAGPASAGPSSAGPSSATSEPSTGISPSGPPPFPLATSLAGSGSRWKNTPAAQMAASAARPPNSNYVPRAAPPPGPGQQGGRSPLNALTGGLSPHAGGYSPHDARTGGVSTYDPRAGGRSPHDAGAGGRSPNDYQRGDVRPPANPYSSRSPVAGNMSPMYGGNTLMSTVAGTVGNQRVDGASGWSNGQHAAGPANGNRSPPWAQPSAGFGRPTRPPAVRPATVDVKRDPRRRAAAGAGAPANPTTSTTEAPRRLSASTAPPLQPLGELGVAFPGKESHILKVMRGFTKNTSGMFSLSRYIDKAKAVTSLVTANTVACLDMALNQGAHVREWAHVIPENARAWDGRFGPYLNAKDNRGPRIFFLRDEVPPSGQLKGHDLLILARAEDAGIGSMLGSFQLDQLNLVLIVLAMPLSGKPLPTLPNPVDNRFPVLPQMRQSAANATTLLQSYGLNDTVMASFRGKTSAVFPNLANTKEYDIVINALKDNGVGPSPGGGSPADIAIVLNGYWHQALGSGTMLKYVKNATKFYSLGSDLQLPVGEWPLRDIWSNGGLVQLSPTMIMTEPGRVRELMKRIRSVDNWAAYVTPLSLLYVQESVDMKNRCPDKNATLAALSELLFANEDLDPIAGDRSTDFGGLAVSTAPPAMEMRKDCVEWIDWRNRVLQCTSFDTMIELCKLAVGEGGRLLHGGGASPTKTTGPLNGGFVEEENVKDLVEMRSRPEIVPYRRFMYVGESAPGLDQQYSNKVEFVLSSKFNWEFSNSL